MTVISPWMPSDSDQQAAFIEKTHVVSPDCPTRVRPFGYQ